MDSPHVRVSGDDRLRKRSLSSDMQDDGKKRRGPDPVVCAECRRLKLKCDRRWPCSTCFRRGCAAICPSGTLGAEQRAPTSESQYLQFKVQAMTRRIAELEDALAALQAQISDKPHPLLSDAFRAPSPQEQPPEDATESTGDTLTYRLGTLTLGEREHFFGQHAVADFLIDAENNASKTPESCSSLPLDVLILSGGFPMSNIREARAFMTAKLACRLPSAAEASKLIDIYYRHATWIHMPIPRDELDQTIFAAIYNGAAPSIADITTHELGMFFVILAIGCAVDPERPCHNAAAATYYELGRAALAIESVIDNPTIPCIRALSLMSKFLQLYEHHDSPTLGYGIVGLATRFAQSLGLHRDDTPWNLPEKEQQKRRHLFWEIAVQDYWSGFAYGRPPCLTLAHVDAKHAEDTEKFLGSDGKWQASFRHWLHTFTHKVMFKVLEQAFGVRPPTYDAVLRLDRLIRDHPISDGLRIVNIEASQAGVPEFLILQRYMVFTLTHRVLLFLHRSFFARALTDFPDDPLKSKYPQSVLAAFRCALYITTSVRRLHTEVPLALRLSTFWTPILSAYFVLVSIVIKSPGSGLSPPAWIEVNKVCEWLELLAPMSRSAERIMPEVRALRQKAQEAYTAFTAASGGIPRPMDTEFEEIEKRFGCGCSRLVDNASKSHSPNSTNNRRLSFIRASNSPSALPIFPTTHDSASSSAANAAPPQAGASGSATFFDSYSWHPCLQLPSFSGQTHQPQQQPKYPWDFDPIAPAPPGGSQLPPNSQLPHMPGFGPPTSFGMPPVNWRQMDNLTQLPQLSTASNLDMPWQLFMSGISIDERRQQQDSSSGFGSGPTS